MTWFWKMRSTNIVQQLQESALLAMHWHLRMLVMAPMFCSLHVGSRMRSTATNAVSRCSKRQALANNLLFVRNENNCRGEGKAGGGGAKAGFSCTGVCDGHTALFVHFEVKHIPIALMHLRMIA